MRRTTIIILIVVVILVLAGYAAAIGMFAVPNVPAWITERPIAHRGQWTEGGEAPENSLAAFRRAADSGYTVELDVHHTKDKRVVVVHDDDLVDVTGERGIVSDMTLAQVKQRYLKGGAERVPTLEEALALIGGKVPVLVEIKNDGEVGDLEDDVAEQVSGYQGEVAVMSFNPFSVARVARSAPDVPRGQLSGSFEGEDLEFYEVFLLRRLLMNWKSDPDFIAYELEELPTLGSTMQRWRGRPLLVWTAETPDEWSAAEKLGDAVIANPEALPER